jgi:hypothetical protein
MTRSLFRPDVKCCPWPLDVVILSNQSPGVVHACRENVDMTDLTGQSILNNRIMIVDSCKKIT